MEAEESRKRYSLLVLYVTILKNNQRNLKFTFRTVELVVCFRRVFYDKGNAALENIKEKRL